MKPRNKWVIDEIETEPPRIDEPLPPEDEPSGASEDMNALLLQEASEWFDEFVRGWIHEPAWLTRYRKSVRVR